MSVEEFEDLQLFIRSVLGTRRSVDLRGLHFKRAVRGDTIARGLYNAEYENGSVILDVTFQQQRGEWRVIGIRYRSDLLEQRSRARGGNVGVPPGDD